MALNIELLRAAVAWVESEEAKGDGGSWEQGVWAEGIPTEETVEVPDSPYPFEKIDCGTGMCLAGWVCHIAGDTFVARSSKVDDYANEGLPIEVSDVVDFEGRKHLIPSRALALLGLESSGITEVDDMGEAFWDLFEGDNDVEDIRHIATLIAAEHGYEL